MNAASLQTPAGSPPVAAAPSAPPGGASASGGITPVAGQGFVPAAGAAQGAQGAQAAAGQPTAEQVLASLVQVLGAEYGEPIIGADGTVYMEKKRPNVANGTIALSYLVVGKVDKATGKLTPSPEVLKLVQEKAKAGDGSKRVLVKVGDQMVWQTFSKDENGKPIVSEMAPATEQELAAYQQEQAAEQAKQAAQAKLQNRGDWQQKIGVVAQNMGLFGSVGSTVMGLAGGPNPYSGRPGASWISGWILAQRLNGKSEGKLLPKWMQSGPVATALDFGIQTYGMLDMGNDVRVLRDFFGKKPPLPPVNPNAVQQLIAKGHHPAMAQAMAGLGKELRETGTMQLVDGTANAALLNTKLGAAQLVPKGTLHEAFNATDPLQSSGLKARAAVDGGIHKGLGALKGLVQPAMMGATALGLISSVISVKNLVATQGKDALINTQQGRGAILGAATSAAFLGLYALPQILPGLGMAMPAVMATMSAVNIAQNILGGVQLLNSYGLFGGEQGKAGFLDNDVVRGAFLIPPLTPLGAFAFWMKSKKKKQAAEAAKLEAAQKLAVEKIKQQREMAKLQLQSTGQISGAVQGPDGSIVVNTGVPNDPAKMVAMLNGGGAPPGAGAPAASGAPPAAASGGQSAAQTAIQQQRQQLTMTARPM